MNHIHVLTPGWTNPNSIAFLFPFKHYQRDLREENYTITFFQSLTGRISDCDILLIDSKFYAHNWDPLSTQKTFDDLAALRTGAKVIWCDQTDSSGAVLSQVLAHVDRYAKAQILADKNLYLQKHYAARIYADYYHQTQGITDADPYDQAPVHKTEDLTKIALSWNSGLMNYGSSRPFLMKLWSLLPCQPFLDFSKTTTSPQTKRDFPLSCRMGISYPRATVRYQRERLRELLRAHIKTDKISHGSYLREIETSKISLSPFGYGEITLKDFETFLCGAALLKPDMGHMRTWPDFYEPWKTYVPFSWDLTDVEEIIERLLHDHERRIAIASEGQKRYLAHTIGPEAAALFVAHFKAMIDLGQSPPPDFPSRAAD